MRALLRTRLLDWLIGPEGTCAAQGCEFGPRYGDGSGGMLCERHAADAVPGPVGLSESEPLTATAEPDGRPRRMPS